MLEAVGDQQQIVAGSLVAVGQDEDILHLLVFLGLLWLHEFLDFVDDDGVDGEGIVADLLGVTLVLEDDVVEGFIVVHECVLLLQDPQLLPHYRLVLLAVFVLVLLLGDVLPVFLLLLLLPLHPQLVGEDGAI